MSTDTRPEMGTVTVGQVVIVDSIRTVVTRVGRVWIDVNPEDGSGYLPHYSRRFRLDTQDTGADTSRHRFVTEAQYAWDLRQSTAREFLNDAGIRLSDYDRSRYKGRELELANVLRAHEGLDPL